jgi:ABC-2 type transport system ATP-binding protein
MKIAAPITNGQLLATEKLAKVYGGRRVVDGVSVAVGAGEIVGLLGPNGAGKTTTISMISCLLSPDEGDVLVDGHSVRTASSAVRRVLGVVPQEIALYPTLTAAENLRFWGRMYGLSGRTLSDAIAYGLKMAGLEDQANKRIETYSGGMKRRINIAAGILHRPRVLLMDEPTVGIDPQSRNHILDTVRELNSAGMTVLYTSHYMEEVEALCDRIAIIDHGRAIALGTLEELRALVGDEDRLQIELGEQSCAEALTAVRAVSGVSRAELVDSTLELFAPDAAAVLGGIVGAIAQAGATVRSVTVVEPNLESVFLHLTGRALRD